MPPNKEEEDDALLCAPTPIDIEKSACSGLAEGESSANVKDTKKWDGLSAFRIFVVFGCLLIVGLLTAILVVLVTQKGDTSVDPLSSTTAAASTSSTSSSLREFIGSESDVDRICEEASLRLTYETTRTVQHWEVVVKESLCCDDWSDVDCHVLGLQCAECQSKNLTKSGKCSKAEANALLLQGTEECAKVQSRTLPDLMQECAMEQCSKLQSHTLSDLLQECEAAGGTVQTFEETILHSGAGYSPSPNHKGQKGLVAKCVMDHPSQQAELQQVGVVCGVCETWEWNVGYASYIQREDCRVLAPTYPTCDTCTTGGGGEGSQGQGTPMITSETINDLLSLCQADELAYRVTRVHPRKYGDGNELELNAYCNSIGDFYLMPLFGVNCGHCESGQFVPSGRCNGVEANLLESEAKCSTYVQTDVEKECQPEGYGGGGSQMGYIGEYGGNLTRAVLVCCSGSKCPGDNVELSGLFCGECVGQEYVPYRNCSRTGMLEYSTCSD